MKIAFYRGTGKLFDRITRWVTRGPFSHVELVFSDGMCASSSFRDGGVRFKRIDFHPERWVFVDLRPYGFDEAAARAWFVKHEECRYDVFGLLGFLWRRVTGSSNRYFCSEALMAALGTPQPWRFCPNTMAAVFNAKH